MCRRFLPLLLLLTPATLRADAFDNYTNPVLQKAPAAPGVKEIKQLTPDLIAEHNNVIANASAALLVVQTNEGRMSKLLVQSASRKTGEGDNAKLVPILLIDRYATYREGSERTLQASGQNLFLFDGFHLNLDMGQVVPAQLGADLRFTVKELKDKTEISLEPVGKAKLYLVTKAMPEASPKKTGKFVMGETFEPRCFAGKFKLHDDGRRAGLLELQVADDGKVSGSFTSDKDGQQYPVKGKVGSPKNSIQFTIRFPRTEQTFQGWLFTGTGLALTGSSRLQDREAGFYALRIEEE